MRKKTFLFLSCAILSANVGSAQNFTGVYDFSDVTNSSGSTDPTPVPVATGVIFGGITAVGVSANSNASARFSFTKWPVGATDGDNSYSSLTGAVNTSGYYEVTISPESGYMLDLTDITFSVRRSSTGIRTYVVRSSVDGYASNIMASIDPANTKLNIITGDIFFWALDSITTSQNGSKITLGGINYTNLSTATTFRFYGYNSEGTAGTFSIDNVTFTGTANVVTSVINAASETITVYPNPSSNGVFTVENVPDKTIITVYNILGKIILSKEINAFSKSSIDLSNQANGNYFITLKNNQVTNIQRILINK